MIEAREISSTSLTPTIQRMQKDPSIQAVFDKKGIHEKGQEFLLGLALKLALQQAQTGGEPLTPAEQQGFLNHLTTPTMIKLINHTGLAATYERTLARQAENK